MFDIMLFGFFLYGSEFELVLCAFCLYPGQNNEFYSDANFSAQTDSWIKQRNLTGSSPFSSLCIIICSSYVTQVELTVYDAQI